MIAGCGFTATRGFTPGAMRIAGFCGAGEIVIFGAAGVTVGFDGLMEIGASLTGSAGFGAGAALTSAFGSAFVTTFVTTFVSTFCPSAAALAVARWRARASRSDARLSRRIAAAFSRFAARLVATSRLPSFATASFRAASSPSSIVLIAFVTSAPQLSAALMTSALVTPASFASSYTLIPKIP